MMDITINDKRYTVADGATIAEVMDANGVRRNGVAVAVNGVVVAASEWDGRRLSDGDTVVIIRAFYGG